MSAVAPGWYDDGSGGLRYWDGTAWTEHTAPRYSQAAPASGPRKSAGRWVWITVGAVSLVLVGLTAGVILLVGAHAGPVREARAAVDRYNSAWLGADCAALIDSTTVAFREQWGYDDCDAFAADATDFDQVDRGYSTYVNDAKFESGHVIVTTTESYTDTNGEWQTDKVTYTVVHDGDDWHIDAIDFAGDHDDSTDT